MRILVVTGASGGHIFPALSFLDTLKEKNKGIDTLLILPRSLKGHLIPAGFKVGYIPISKIKLNLGIRNLFAILRFFKGFLESSILLLEFKPDIIVGFGSLTSVPIVLWGWIFRIKTLIHEQNVIAGRANRFLARFADKIAIAFSETKDYFQNSPGKIIHTGNPIRKEFEKINKNKALDFFGFDYNKFTILVMGGSQGSRKINSVLLNTISMMSDRSNLQIIHLTGPGDYNLLEDRYKDLNIDIKLFSFLKEMQYAYSASDLVICRAGATTITEIIFFKLPAIIIPYPFAYGHQLMNAKVLESKGCAIIIKDNELDANILRYSIENLIHDADKIRKMRSGYDNINQPNANELLVDEVLNLS